MHIFLLDMLHNKVQSTVRASCTVVPVRSRISYYCGTCHRLETAVVERPHGFFPPSPFSFLLLLAPVTHLVDAPPPHLLLLLQVRLPPTDQKGGRREERERKGLFPLLSSERSFFWPSPSLLSTQCCQLAYSVAIWHIYTAVTYAYISWNLFAFWDGKIYCRKLTSNLAHFLANFLDGSWQHCFPRLPPLLLSSFFARPPCPLGRNVKTALEG